MKKLKLNSTLNHKQSEYNTHEIIVEKVITLYGNHFSELKNHTLDDDPYIAENRDLMCIDSSDTAHCLLMVDSDSGDGILVESEGSNYARKSQFIPNARALVESNEMTLSERKLHNSLKKMVDHIAELAHCGDRNFIFDVYVLKSNQTVTVYEDFETGKIIINKTSEDKVVRNIEFKVTGSNGSSCTKKTNAVGIAEFASLPVYDMKTGKAITYNVSEINVATRYETPKAQNVTLVNGDADLTVNVGFDNELKKGKILINKQAEDGEVAGRLFTVTGNGKTYIPFTNANGVAMLSNLPVYDSNNNKIVYTISERDVPIKYVVPANQTVTLTADETVNVTFENKLKKFTAEVTKKDFETGVPQGEATLSGAVYGLYLDGELVDKYTTDENGYFKTKEYVCGNYTLQEISPSEGYLLDEAVHSVGAEPKNYTAERNLIPIDVTEDIVKGKIQIIKHSDDGTTQIEKPEVGAEFQVYLKSAGSYDNAESHEKDYIICDENGFAETKLLPYGLYVVHQTKGIEGSVNISDFEVNINENDKTYTYLINNAPFESYTVNTGFVNDYQNVEISLEKVMEEDEKFNIYGEDAYLNVRFGLFADEEITAANGASIPKDGFIAEVSLDENMTAEFTEKLPFGKYYVQEISTDEKYVLNGEKYLVSFEYQGQEMTTVYVDCGQFENNLKRGKIKGLKVNEADEPLEDAVFGLYSADCTEFYADNAIMSASSDSNGEFGFENIPLGSYIIHEIFAPTGYVLSDESYPVTVSENEETINIRTVNEKIKGNVTVTKIDEEYPDNRLSGAEFTVYADEKCESEIGKLSETEKGIYTLSDLEYGKYYLKETVAPDGFILDENVYPFSIENDRETVEVSNTEVGKGFVNKPEEGGVEITKTDISTGELIPNCGIEILDKDGNVVIQGRTDENGVVKFEKLRVGDYYYREFDAPDGYILDENSYPFTIKENGEIVKCQMTNTKIPHQPTPYTGDNSSDLLAWVMIGISLAIGSVLFICKKKKTSMKGLQNEDK